MNKDRVGPVVSERASHKYMSLPFSFYHSSHQSPFNMDKRAQQQTKKKRGKPTICDIWNEKQEEEEAEEEEEEEEEERKEGEEDMHTATIRTASERAHTHTKRQQFIKYHDIWYRHLAARPTWKKCWNIYLPKHPSVRMCR